MLRQTDKEYLREYHGRLTTLGEDLQKLRTAKKMLKEYSVAKVAEYVLLTTEEIANLDKELTTRKKIYSAATADERNTMDYGVRYTDKIVARTMLADGKDAAAIKKYADVNDVYIKKISLPKFYLMGYDRPHDMVWVGTARWLTIEEEARFNHANAFDCVQWLENTELNFIKNEQIEEIVKKSPYFEGEHVYFMNYVITKELHDEILKCEAEAKAANEVEKLKEKIDSYKKILDEYKKHKLYHQKDVPALRKEYNDLYNEGGEGYIPHFYTFEAQEYYKKELKKLIDIYNKK